MRGRRQPTRPSLGLDAAPTNVQPSDLGDLVSARAYLLYAVLCAEKNGACSRGQTMHAPCVGGAGTGFCRPRRPRDGVRSTAAALGVDAASPVSLKNRFLLR